MFAERGGEPVVPGYLRCPFELGYGLHLDRVHVGQVLRQLILDGPIHSGILLGSPSVAASSFPDLACPKRVHELPWQHARSGTARSPSAWSTFRSSSTRRPRARASTSISSTPAMGAASR